MIYNYIKIFFLLIALTFSWLSSSFTIIQPPSDNYLIRQQQWADSVLATMTLDEKIGQLFMIATYSNRNEQQYQQVENLIRTYKVGGLIFFQGEPISQASLTNRYQTLARIPLLIGIDAEWGLGMRLDNAIDYPKQITLGAIQDNAYLEKYGEEVARQCRRMGIHINFAPSVDVNTNPNNPVINYRSFGENPQNVAEKGAAFVRGMRKQRVMTSAKHFPGHGDTDEDSHHTLPWVSHSLQRLNEVELYPFRRIIQDSVSSIMTGHLFVPSLEAKSNTPASISRRIVTDVIKNEMGFQGLTVTDALNMRGITAGLQPGEADYLAFLAGNDILLQTGNLPAAFNRIRAAIQNKQVELAELDRRVLKILKAKFWVGLNNYRPIEVMGLLADINSSIAKDLKTELMEQAITIVKNEDNLLPFMNLDTTSFASVVIGAQSNNVFQKTLSQYANFRHFSVPFKPSTEKDLMWVMEESAKAEVVVVGIHDMNSRREGNYGITPATVSFINNLSKKTKVVVVAFGNPYGLRLFQNQNTVVCGYEDDVYSEKVVPQVLFGGLPARGKLPISPSNNLKAGDGFQTEKLGRVSFGRPENVGMSRTKLEEIDRFVQENIANRVFPGGQVLVARNGKIIYNKNFGTLRYDMSEPVTDQTIYDIASMTKVSATLQAVMMLNENGAIDLNEKASYYLPEMKGTNKELMTLGDILQHQAGLLSFVPFWEKTKISGNFRGDFYRLNNDSGENLQVAEKLFITSAIRDSVWNWVLKTPLSTRFDRLGGYRYTYSDLGLMILQKVVERVTNQPLDEFVEQNIYEPLGMAVTMYNPLRKFPKTQIAPTEYDGVFRGVQVQGTVHDPNAALMGGVSGHAGLFSNVLDLIKLYQMNLQKGVYGDRRIFFSTTVPHFAKNYTEKSHRGLGWDKPDFERENSIVSDYASPRTFGHTGFTGTCVWIDPEKELVFIFLCNRVYPSSNNSKMTSLKVRRRLHDLVYQSIIN